VFFAFNDNGFLNPATLNGSIFYAMILLVLAWMITKVLNLAVKRALESKSSFHIDRTRIKFLDQLAGMVIYISVFIFYAHLVPFFSGLGQLSLASVGMFTVIAGLAAQNTLGNLIAGISLLLYRPFNIGDRLQVASPTGLETGVVLVINLGYTLLKTDDNRHVVVPNNMMANQTTINLTRDDPQILCSIPILITHDSNLTKARAILMALAKANPRTLKIGGCPVTQLDGFGVVLTLSVWCANSVVAGDLKCDLLEQIKNTFDAQGIMIPVFEKALVIPRYN
jgi:small-conductance mechanosensitive channel